ncbi:MAG: PAS domain S-box protein [Methanomicrobiaceae archaeon]|uniref:histidine kinase n=1 Tax=hydrocarbon metagenome TaxID=938273 RepID=A0A0W8FFY6_9ZZZZ|nr:PAS domain S-box protein [Methanomicrobiaceae archaeon]MDD5418763.1 PAS domain S-box protein [Methanomicrobiaceae archaeon]
MSEEHLREVIRATGAGYYEHAADLSSGWISERCAEILGFAPEEMPQYPDFAGWLTERIHQEDRPEATGRMADLLAGRIQRFEQEYRIRAKDGSWRWVRAITAAVQRDAEGRPRCVAGLLFDISGRKKANEEFREAKDHLETRVKERMAEPEQTNRRLSEEIARRREAEEAVEAEQRRFYDVLETLPAYLVLLTPDYHVSHANRFFRERFGESGGRRCFEYLFGRSEPCENCETYTVLKTGAPHEWEWLGPDGRNYHIFDYPFTDTDGSTLIMEMGIDITGHKQVEEALRLANAYNRSLLEASLDPLVTISPEGKITDVNDATVQATGYSREDLIGTDFSGYFTEPERAKAGYERVFRDGAVRDYELRIRHRNGRITPVLYNATVFLDESGEVAGVFAAARDITERKQAEEEWSRLAAIVDSSDDAIIGKSLDGIITSWNFGAEKLYGYTAREAVGRHVSLLLPPAHADDIDQILEKVRQGEPLLHYETVRMSKGGNLVEVSLAISPIRDREGRLVGASTIARDVTERRRAEETVRLANAYNRSLLEASLDPLVTISPEGKITDVNDATVQVTGYSREDLIGTDFSGYFTEPERAKAGYERVFRDGAVRDYELRIRHRNGRITPVLYNATVFLDDSGEVAGVFAAARDITERKRAEEALMKSYRELDERVKERTAELLVANQHLEKEIAEHKATADELSRKSQELERSNLELQQFAYVASHDLQEPLRAISGFTELLEKRYKGHIDERADKYIHFIVEGTKQMDQIIHDLLAYSRVQTSTHEFGLIDANKALDQALLNLHSAIQDKKAIITHDPLPEIFADGTQITQVFQNLIGNALKFQRPGIAPKVHISATRAEGRWIFSVADNGIGIEPRFADRIFLIFQRLHAKGEYEGTGIGLAICKRIIERHGGEITVQSVPGEGTTFFFSIPNNNEESTP